MLPSRTSAGSREPWTPSMPIALLAERSLDHLQLGRQRRASMSLAGAFDDEGQRQTGRGRDDALHLLEAVDGLAIDRNDHVVGLDTGLGRDAAVDHGFDARDQDLARRKPG